MRTNWNIMDEGGYNLNLKRYRRYLEEKGYRESTVEGYLSCIGRYLEFVGTDKPTQKNFDEFKEAFLFERHLSRYSINNYYCTIDLSTIARYRKIATHSTKRGNKIRSATSDLTRAKAFL